jgi:DNA polymerase III alpha subunit
MHKKSLHDLRSRKAALAKQRAISEIGKADERAVRRFPEAIEQTAEIASRVNFSMDELSYNFPDYKVRHGETMDSVLRAKAIERSIERYRHCPGRCVLR